MKKMIFKSISQIEKDGIEDIFQKYFDCQNPFAEDPVVENSDFCEAREMLSESGAEAYDKLIGLIYDLGKIILGFDPAMVVDEIDEIITRR